jgi:hypothetical protein
VVQSFLAPDACLVEEQQFTGLLVSEGDVAVQESSGRFLRDTVFSEEFLEGHTFKIGHSNALGVESSEEADFLKDNLFGLGGELDLDH